ncbi:uncharacterized protein AMSG_09840 [Thecamonas trahens ATCC 50062]|uniref:Uncharacterized protein n=1 Tax=Thecamonas trahens ATCC 50062 TaxID=461836 RepID=A0A0L0DNI7_THETB|nr:hypothetical protein AMSG_09840 [Thecamonas trahens ATCC 50062]KNC53882.1 hypothetical protein AMSG_09840 [Thecamonas trahens ATCC 50062]|eukprot:XP_013754258.1 hypothetical protein AMSG_09840 [Thecamonas trahens ATCC 50062]
MMLLAMEASILSRVEASILSRVEASILSRVEASILSRVEASILDAVELDAEELLAGEHTEHDAADSIDNNQDRLVAGVIPLREYQILSALVNELKSSAGADASSASTGTEGLQPQDMVEIGGHSESNSCKCCKPCLSLSLSATIHRLGIHSEFLCPMCSQVLDREYALSQLSEQDRAQYHAWHAAAEESILASELAVLGRRLAAAHTAVSKASLPGKLLAPVRYAAAIASWLLPSMSDVWKAVWTRRCPGCKAPVYKDGGCSHMTCGVCRTQYCWFCSYYNADAPAQYYGGHFCSIYGVLTSNGIFGPLYVFLGASIGYYLLADPVTRAVIYLHSILGYLPGYATLAEVVVAPVAATAVTKLTAAARLASAALPSPITSALVSATSLSLKGITLGYTATAAVLDTSSLVFIATPARVARATAAFACQRVLTPMAYFAATSLHTALLAVLPAIL